MPIEIVTGRNVPIALWTRADEVERSAMQQLHNIAKLPWVFHHVAVMPDVHYGKGATVGSVIAMKGAVSPAAVGVDIGCGMAAVKTSLTANDLPDSLAAFRRQVEQAIPVGFESHQDPLNRSKRLDLWKRFDRLDKRVHRRRGRAVAQIGTLGGGNHFIEMCLDTEDSVWLMLHSGSRNIGKELADVHISTAKKLAHNRDLPDRDLSVFLAGTPQMKAYRHDLFWAQQYAFENRAAMLELLEKAVRQRFPAAKFDSAISCHHNYVAEETHFGEDVLVTRKGAIRAGAGELGIIPGSMGARSFIVRGKGNPDAFESASHGAGRRMSRTAAKKRYTVHDLELQTRGVECRKDRGVLDEIPAAYKDIQQVIDNQRDLVEIVAELRQVMCIKG